MRLVNLKVSILSLLALGLLCGSALAQNIICEADIPFSFIVENTTLPPGKYIIRQASESMSALEIAAEKGGAVVYFLVDYENLASIPKENELVFNIYGNKHFLSKIIEEANSLEYSIVKSRSEMALVKKESKKTTRVKALKTK